MADCLYSARAIDPGAEDRHGEDGDRRRIAETRDTFFGRNETQGHENGHHGDRRNIGRKPLADEANQGK